VPSRAIGAGGAGGGQRSGGVGPPKPAGSPQGCDSGEWVTQLERCPPPATGPTRLALCVVVSNPGEAGDAGLTGGDEIIAAG